MALVLNKVTVTDQALQSVASILRNHFQVEEQVEGIDQLSGGGVNDPNHRVAKTAKGRQYGVKTQSRGGGPDGERREEAFSKVCQAMGIDQACRAIRVESIPHMDGFDKTSSVITEWAVESKRVQELTPQEKQQMADLPRVMNQLGKWVATNLHSGLGDRAKLDNWVWSHANQGLTAIDTESAFNASNVSEHHPLIDSLYGKTKLKQERGNSEAAKAFEAGLRGVHEQFIAHPEVISPNFAGAHFFA
jgi:hypothetical protein